ncbi:hypothetical protein ACFO4N_10455 [Camelliibacillus cellulosilyticus]|uniref:Spore germination protein GerPA/GerPF n=1 Tax=Camelliibacillus cellulosilyticus TaxID=2174486 RepID=A0ABV9GR57_9BACL
MSVNIAFIAINVNSVNRASAVSVGENNQPNYTAHGKNNLGIGNVFGLNFAANMINNILDNDFIDMPFTDNDGIPTGQNQTL